MADNARREALAQRMSKLLGLPISNIQLLMPLVAEEDLEKLENLPDDQFLSQATKIINTAQKKQFEEAESSAAAAGDADSGSNLKPMGAAAPTASLTTDEPEAEPEEPATRKKPKIGRKGQSDASDDPEEAEAPDMPSVFQRPQKKSSMFDDKRVVMMVVAGAVALVVLIGCATFLFINMGGSGPSDGPVVNVPNGGGDPAGGGNGAPAQDVYYAHKWALKMASTFDVPVSSFAATNGATTVEFWLKPQIGTGRQEVLITGEGSEAAMETFQLSFVRLDEGGYQASFTVPAASSKAAEARIPADAEGHWVHVAGVFDPLTSGKIYLYVSGIQLASESTNGLADLTTNTYRIISTSSTSDGEGFLLDEVRLTNAPLYLGDFTPSRILEPIGDTVSLLHLEQWDDGTIRDAAANDVAFELTGGELVNIADEMDEPQIYQLRLAPIPFPDELLSELQRRKGKVFALNFVSEWKSASRSDRIAYLRALNYPEHRLAALMDRELQ